MLKVTCNRASLICGASLLALVVGAPGALAQGPSEDGDRVVIVGVVVWRVSRRASSAAGSTMLLWTLAMLRRLRWAAAAAAVVLLPLVRGMPWGAQRPRPAQRRWPLWLLATLLGTSAGIALQQMALQRLPGALAVALLALLRQHN